MELNTKDTGISTDIIPHDVHTDATGITTDVTQQDVHSSLHFHTDFESQMQDKIKNITDHIEHLMQSLRELQARLDTIQDSTKNKSPGCGFSCSNNSFAL